MAIDYLKDIKNAAAGAGGIDYLADLKKTDNSTWTSRALARGKQGAVDVVTNDYNRIKANAQAAYDGLLSFGATLTNVVTKNSKGAANAALTALAPLNASITSYKPTADKQISNYVQGQNDQFTANLGKYGQGLQVPYMAGQAVASMPLNPLFKGLSALPGMAASVLPTGLKTAGKLATGALSGMAAGGLFGAATYDPANPNVLNSQAAEDYGLNPLSAGLGILGSSLGGYASQTNKLAQAESKGYGTMVLNRDVSKPKVKALADNVFGSMPIIGDAGTRFSQQQSFIPGVQKFIKSISANVGDDIANASGTTTLNSAVKSALKSAKTRIIADETAIWKPINDIANKITLGGAESQAVKEKFIGFMQQHGDELSISNKGLASFINRGILNSKNPHPSFEQLKQTKTMVQKYLSGSNSMSKPAMEDAQQLISGLYDNLDDAIYKVDPALVTQYHKANAFTAAKYKMFNEAGPQFKAAYKATDLEQAVTDNAAAYSFAKTLIKENSPDKIKASMAPFTTDEANKIRAGVVNKALKQSIHSATNNFNITKFLELTSQEKNMDVLMGPTYKSLQGLQELMQPVQQALNTAKQGGMAGNMRQGAAYAGIAAAGAGAYTAPALTAGIVGSAAALAKISQYSPLKRILIAVTGAKSNPRLLEAISKEAHSKIQRYGLVIGATPDGSPHLQSKEEVQQ